MNKDEMFGMNVHSDSHELVEDCEMLERVLVELGILKRVEYRWHTNDRKRHYPRILIDEYGMISADTTPLHTFDF